MRTRSRPRLLVVIVCLCLLATVFSEVSALTRNSYSSNLSPGSPQAMSLAIIPGNPITEYQVPTSSSGPESIALSPNQTLWFTELQAGKIGSFSLANGTFSSPKSEFPVPLAGASPATIAIDNHGTVWFTDENNQSGTVWSFSPSESSFNRFVLSDPKTIPLFVLVDPLNNVWFTEINKDKIGELAYPGYALSEFSLPSIGSGPAELALQPGSSYLWITEEYAGRIARFDMSVHSFEEFNPSVELKYPVGVAVDTKGSVWIAEHGGSAIVQFQPSSLAWTKYPTSIPATVQQGYSAPATLAVDKTGRLWFLEHYSNKVGRLDPATGQISEFNIPTPGAYSLEDTLDPNGNFWFTEFYADRIGVIPSYALPSVLLTGSPFGPIDASAGLGVSLQILVTNLESSSPALVAFAASASFSDNGQTGEVTFNPSSLDLSQGGGRTVIASITPRLTSASGLYSVGLAAVSGNYTTVMIVFVQVHSFVDNLVTFLPEIVLSGVVVFLAALFLVKRWKIRKRTTQAHTGSTPAKDAVSVRVFLLLALFFLISVVGLPRSGLVLSKCPGLPPPPVGKDFAGGDPYNFYVEVALVGIVVAVLGFVVWRILSQADKQSWPPPPPPF